MILGSVGEWIIGNTFPFVVFGTFGAFWLTFGATLQPFYNAYGAYVTDPTSAAKSMGQPGNPAGQMTPGFNASFAFFLVFMGKYRQDHVQMSLVPSRWLTFYTGLICLIFLICSLRTNIVFFIIFFTLIGGFCCLAAAYWNLALAYENPTNTKAAMKALKLVKVSTHPQTCLHHTGPQGLGADQLLGWRCIHVRHIHGRLVDLLRYHACVA